MCIRSLLVVIVLAFAPVCDAWGRVWTLQDGTTIEAKFHRLRSGELWLKSRGQVARIPVGQLSNGDAHWTTVWQQAREARTWTKRWGDEEIEGRFVRYQDGNVVVDTGSGQAEVDYSILNAEDQQFVRAVLATRRRQDDVPSSVGQPKVELPEKKPETAYEQWLAEKTRQPADVVANGGEVSQDIPTSEPRVWTNVAGDQLLGRFASTNTDSQGFGRVVITQEDGNMEVYFNELCDSDQEYVQQQLRGRSQTDAACATCSRSLTGFTASQGSQGYQAPRRLVGIHTQRPRLNGFRSALNEPKFRDGNEMRPWDRPALRAVERTAERLDRHADPRNPNWKPEEYQPDQRPTRLGVIEAPIPGIEEPEVETERAEPASVVNHQRQIGAIFAQEDSPAPEEKASTMPSQTVALDRLQAPAKSTRTTIVETGDKTITCGNCGETFTSEDFRAGDACQHCGRAIHRVDYADGSAEYSRSYWKPLIHISVVAVALLAAFMYARMR